MVCLRHCLLSLCGAFALLLIGCGGGGGGSSSSTSLSPALSDNGGLWVGTWTGTSGPGAGAKGLVAVEFHQDGSNLTGNATATNGPLSPDQACTGTVNGSSLQFGILGHVDYTGTLSDTTASGTFTDHDSATSGNWTISRYLGPFDGTATPTTIATGSWTVKAITSKLSPNPPDATLNILYLSGNDLHGTVTQSSSYYSILAGHVAGTKVWYAYEPDATNILVVAYGDMSGTTGSGGYVQYDTAAASNPEDQGTWTATNP